MADIVVGGKVENMVVHQDRYKIELAKGQRGTYGWTVTTYAKTVTEAIDQLKIVDEQLKESFGNGNGTSNSTTE